MKVYISTIVKSDDQILLIEEGKPNCYGKWNVPSGHLEEDENILAGAVREVKEETGLDAKLVRLIGIYNNQYEGNNSIQFSFLAEAKGVCTNTFFLPGECWFSWRISWTFCQRTSSMMVG